MTSISVAGVILAAALARPVQAPVCLLEARQIYWCALTVGAGWGFGCWHGVVSAINTAERATCLSLLQPFLRLLCCVRVQLVPCEWLRTSRRGGDAAVIAD